MSTKRLIRGLADNKTTVLMSMIAVFAMAAVVAFGLWPALVEAREAGGLSHEVRPGELDDYYGFFSGGHSGEIRVVGLAVDASLQTHPGLQHRLGKRLGNYQRKQGDAHGRYAMSETPTTSTAPTRTEPTTASTCG